MFYINADPGSFTVGALALRATSPADVLRQVVPGPYYVVGASQRIATALVHADSGGV